MKGQHPVALLCEVLAVSRSGYYRWRERRPTPRERDDARLAAQIAAAHRRSRRNYGAPRVVVELREFVRRGSRLRRLGHQYSFVGALALCANAVFVITMGDIAMAIAVAKGIVYLRMEFSCWVIEIFGGRYTKAIDIDI